MEFDVSVDDAFGVQVVESPGHVQSHLEVAVPLGLQSLGRVTGGLAALVDIGLEIHLAWFYQHKDSYLFVVVEFLAVPQVTLLGSGLLLAAGCAFGLVGAGAEDKTVGAERVVLDDHLELGFAGLFVFEGSSFLQGVGKKFHPAAIVFEDLWVAELGVDFDFRECAVEVLLGFLEVGARFEFDDLDRVEFAVVLVLRPAHLSKPARTNHS